MAYTAKCDTAAATKWWITGTGSTINRLSEVMDDNAAGVEEDDNPGNFQPWTTFMNEHIEDAIYQILLDLEVGDGSTATTLISTDEHVYFDSDQTLEIKSNATLTLGEKQGDWGLNGAFWSLAPNTFQMNMIAFGGTGIFNMYASMIKARDSSRIDWDGGTVGILNSILCSNSEFNGGFEFKGSGTVKKVYVANCVGFQASGSVIIEDIHLHYCGIAFVSGAGYILKPKNGIITSKQAFELDTDNASAILAIDPAINFSSVRCQNASDAIKEAYSVNIHVADKDGNNLSDVSVLIEDTAGNIVSYVDSATTLNEILDVTETGIDVADGTKFSATDVIFIEAEPMLIGSIAANTLTVTRGYYNTPAEDGHEATRHTNGVAVNIAGVATTDANGDIPEQLIVYKQWHDTDEGLSTYSPHKFTLSKAGYKTLVLENVTIDGPIDWYLELQQQKQSPAPWQEGVM